MSNNEKKTSPSSPTPLDAARVKEIETYLAKNQAYAPKAKAMIRNLLADRAHLLQVQDGQEGRLFFDVVEALRSLNDATAGGLITGIKDKYAADALAVARTKSRALLAKIDHEENKASSSPSVPPLREEGGET